MPTLRQLLPDEDAVMALSAPDLAGYILECLLSLGPMDRGMLIRGNFCSAQAREFSRDGMGFR
jgi:hypothetical protein